MNSNLLVIPHPAPVQATLAKESSQGDPFKVQNIIEER